MANKYYSPEFEQRLIKACLEYSTMAQACAALQINHNSFIKHAKRLGVYNPNQPGRGIHKKAPKLNTFDILSGKFPYYPTFKLALRLLQEGIKERKCEICNNTVWNDKPIPLELHHINGNHYDHLLTNLQFLCRNCHAQTTNFKIRNLRKVYKRPSTVS